MIIFFDQKNIRPRPFFLQRRKKDQKNIRPKPFFLQRRKKEDVGQKNTSNSHNVIITVAILAQGKPSG